MGRSACVSMCGLIRDENPGVSNIKLREIRNRRKNKVSCTMLINAGLVDPKVYPNWSIPKTGKNFNINLRDGDNMRNLVFAYWIILFKDIVAEAPSC